MSTALSVVVPLYNEQDSVLSLVDAVRNALGPQPDWELLLVDDGSTDATARRAAEAAVADSHVRLLPLAGNFGQSLALQAGFDHARGDIIVTMDGDLQNDPADIPILLAKLDEGYDLVVGYRAGRRDALLTRKVPSWLANALLRRLTGLPVRDIGCTLKAYRRELVERIELYADQHRFTPVLASSSFAARIGEVTVRHHPRTFGRSKYGLGRVPRVVADILIVKMILSYHDRPLALYGAGALLALIVSTLFGGAAMWARLDQQSAHAFAVVYPGMALIFAALAGHLLLLGMLGELLRRQWAPDRDGELTLREVKA